MRSSKGDDVKVGAQIDEPANSGTAPATTQVSRPIDPQGRITDWDDLERLWRRAYYELKTGPEDQPMVQSVSPQNSLKAESDAVAKMAHFAFERFRVPELILRPRPSLSLRVSGRQTGLVVQAGHGDVHVVPVFEDFALPHAYLRLPLGSRDLDACLEKALVRRGVKSVDIRPALFNNIVLVRVIFF